MSDLQSGPARALLEEANIVLVDGAFYHQDELIRLNFGTDDAHNMGHLPMLGSAPLLATPGPPQSRAISGPMSGICGK